jgi:lysophospholipase L1-like esterase
MGYGYPSIIAAKYGALYPERNVDFLNRGNSGNKVTDLVTRWQTDTLDLKPDILSILIGANYGESPEEYAAIYDKLLTDTKKALPKIQLVLCEPFGLNDAPSRVERNKYINQMAIKYNAVVAHFQQAMSEANWRFPSSKY